MSATPYAIQYTDDDGETTDITTESDLTEAIRYFYPGSDDPPLSSAASILSGRSFGRSKITVRVNIYVDYDGPALSDAGSLVSLDEYKDRNGSGFSLSLSSVRTGEVDEDAITVSSKDMGSKYDIYRGRQTGPKTIVSGPSRDPLISRSPRPPSSDWDQQTVSSVPMSSNHERSSGRTPQTVREEDRSRMADPSSVFERLKLQESMEEGSPSSSFVSSHLQTERGAAWLRDQNARAVKSVLGNLPEPSESDELSVSAPDDNRSIMSGELELQKDGRGKFYYEYTTGGTSSAAHSSGDSGYDDTSSITFDTGSNVDTTESSSNPRYSLDPASMVERRPEPIPEDNHSHASSSSSHSHHHPNHRSHSEPILPQTDIPHDLLPFITAIPVPPSNPTDCSHCGSLLEQFRYVCSTCGEKDSAQPHEHHSPGKGKGRDLSSETINNPFTYPPRSVIAGASASSASSWTLVADDNPFHDSHAAKYDPVAKPLPAIPSSPPKSVSTPYLSVSGSIQGEPKIGYELCANCIESQGIIHALEHSANPTSSPGPENWPPSPEERQRAFSQWKRSAPKTKGQLRHAFLEKQWGASGWQDVGMYRKPTAFCGW